MTRTKEKPLSLEKRQKQKQHLREKIGQVSKVRRHNKRVLNGLSLNLQYVETPQEVTSDLDVITAYETALISLYRETQNKTPLVFKHHLYKLFLAEASFDLLKI